MIPSPTFCLYSDRYNRLHYWGAGTCLLGLTILVLSDHAGPTAASPHPILGDLCVILGALMYAVTNVAQEKMIVGDVPVREVLGAMGAFGVLIGEGGNALEDVGVRVRSRL